MSSIEHPASPAATEQGIPPLISLIQAVVDQWYQPWQALWAATRIADGPAVRFDRDACRAWLSDGVADRLGINDAFRTSELSIPAGLETLLAALDEEAQPQVWAPHPVLRQVQVWRTADSDGVDGGAIITADLSTGRRSGSAGHPAPGLRRVHHPRREHRHRHRRRSPRPRRRPGQHRTGGVPAGHRRPQRSHGHRDLGSGPTQAGRGPCRPSERAGGQRGGDLARPVVGGRRSHRRSLRGPERRHRPDARDRRRLTSRDRRGIQQITGQAGIPGEDLTV